MGVKELREFLRVLQQNVLHNALKTLHSQCVIDGFSDHDNYISSKPGNLISFFSGQRISVYFKHALVVSKSWKLQGYIILREHTYILSFWYLIFKLCNKVASLRNIKEPEKNLENKNAISTSVQYHLFTTVQTITKGLC